MNLFQKHVDTIIVLGGIFSSVLWMNHELEKDMAVVKAVLIMKNILPQELAMNNKANLVPISKKDIIEENCSSEGNYGRTKN